MNESRRASDQGVVAVAAKAAQATSRSFWQWFEEHHIDSLAVLSVTLVLTIKIALWAMDFAYHISAHLSGTDKAAIIAAVLGPWGLTQAALFKFYVDLKGKKNGVLS